MKDQTYFFSFTGTTKDGGRAFGSTVMSGVDYITATNAFEILTKMSEKIMVMYNLPSVSILNFQRLIEE